MPTGREILERASVLLLDEDHVRWPLAELCSWINEGVKAIVLAKPSASSATIVIPLVAGTLQSVPATGTPTPLILQNISANVRSQTPTRLLGRAITVIGRTILDAEVPNWHDTRYSPFKKDVRHYVYDEAAPLEFFCYPGNTGDGFVQGLVSTLPTKLEATGDVKLPASYEGPVGLPEPYSDPLLDYVLYRAQMKDDLAGGPGRSAMHYQQFATAVGLKIQIEGSTSPNARRGGAK
ncbi:DUF6682 family protein [Mesorhizobium huakuii]|uniref:Uncharacterized protein n=1 Tax=Mesorhizobium huakuii TaxID=28104 RepID=A0A7G6T0U7_9HYPH|nr:DUF6682 family protein [Mesorhizobium huakuii]QND60379.1 hypothetical protein HB778_30405 [Mesorhizobium huakuii]